MNETNTIWVFDYETDNLNEENKAFSASPYYEDNHIVTECFCSVTIDPESGETNERWLIINNETDKTVGDLNLNYKCSPWLLCGHNVRFDYAYRRKGNTCIDLEKAVEEGRTLLWDTQFAEYLLSGQKEKMVSLNDLSEKYGFEPKHDEVKEMWDAGYKTRDVDPDVLDEYVKQDVKITKDIALRQIARAYETGMLDFILFQMRSLYVVHEYEWNGMHVDADALEAIESQAASNKTFWKLETYGCFHWLLRTSGAIKRLKIAHGLTTGEVENLFEEWFDIHSTDKIKRLIFGGPIELKIDEYVGDFKSGKKKGKPRYKKVKYTDTIGPFLTPEDVPPVHLTPKGEEKLKHGLDLTFKEVSLDDKSLDYIQRNLVIGSGPPGHIELEGLLTDLGAYRDLDKLVNTYCRGIRDYIFPDNRIHCNLNVDNTPTGRLTSSNPNLQNIPSGDESEFKQIFTSRFRGGSIGTVDFKQLEVVGLAYLTQDPQLRDDLLNGRDIHTETARTAGIDLAGSHDLRTNIKRVNFGTIYGAAIRKLAQQSGLDESTVRKCVEALKSRYPDAFGRRYIEGIERELDYYAEELDRDGIGQKRFGNYIKQPTGRRIWIETVSQAPFGAGVPEQKWPYTCMRNYPVQSIAADIVSVARVLFYDKIRERGLQSSILMVNEVHDEIVFDIEKNYPEYFVDIVRDVESELPKELEHKLGLQREFDLPLKLEVHVGDNWKEAK